MENRFSFYWHISLAVKPCCVCIVCLKLFWHFICIFMTSRRNLALVMFWCDVYFQWCYWRKLIGWQKMRSMRWDVRWRNIAPLVVWFCVVTPRHASFQQYAVDVLLSGLQRLRTTRLNYYDLCIYISALVWILFFLLSCDDAVFNVFKKGKERMSIYIAPFIYYVYLKALRHGLHSFTCKYTMLAFPSYACTRWRHL